MNYLMQQKLLQLIEAFSAVNKKPVITQLAK